MGAIRNKEKNMASKKATKKLKKGKKIEATRTLDGAVYARKLH
jgi:hypothetical protein